MTVPIWSEVVRTSELVPGQPVTADLLNRIYGNIFATFGLDPDQATVPIFSLPTSGLVTTDYTLISYSGSGNTNEAVVSVIANVCEQVVVGQGKTWNISGAGVAEEFGNTAYLSTASYWSGGTVVGFIVHDIFVNYSSGSPISVTINGSVAQKVNGILPLAVSATITLANTNQNVYGTEIQAKARSDGTKVYLSFKGGSGDWFMPISVKSFVNKAAP